MKLDVSNLRYLTREDFRVLHAVEICMRTHSLAPTHVIGHTSALSRGGSHKSLSVLLRNKLLHHERRLYDGYRLTYPGFDFLALRALVQSGAVTGVGRQMGVGKESDVFACVDDAGRKLVLKLQRLGRVSFRAVRRKRDYVKGNGHASWLTLSRLAALKEFAFMRALHDAGFPTPVPVACNRHALVMTLVEGKILSQVRTLADPGAVFDALMNLILRLARCGLVHGDLNEHNVLVSTREDREREAAARAAAEQAMKDGEEGGRSRAESDASGEAPPARVDPSTRTHAAFIADTDVTVTMIDFPQMVSTSHPNAREMFERDVHCLQLFFLRRFGFDAASVPTWADIGSREGTLDVLIEASGFSAAQQRELDTMMEEQGDAEDGEDAETADADAAGADVTPDGAEEVATSAHDVLAADAELTVDETAALEADVAAAAEADDADASLGDDESSKEDESEEESDGGAAEVPDALLAERPPDGLRARPSGHRPKPRRGEAYLNHLRDQAHSTGDGQVGGLSEAEIRHRVKTSMQKTSQRRAAAAAAAAASANRTKDREKHRSREAVKRGEYDVSSGW